VHAKLLELPNGAHRYAATGEMLRWDDVFSLLNRLAGRHVRRIAVPCWLLRAAGPAGDVVKRIYDFNFPLSREAMEFTTRWPGADAGRTMEDLGLRFRDAREDLPRHRCVDVSRGLSHEESNRKASRLSNMPPATPNDDTNSVVAQRNSPQLVDDSRGYARRRGRSAIGRAPRHG
jgi:hypothetical protein